MRLPRTFAGYVLREVLKYALLGLLAVGALLVLQNALRQFQQMAGMGLGAHDALRLLGILSARFSTYALPLAFVFGVMAAVGRLAADNEVTALRALGVGLGALLAPVLALALGVSAGTAWLLHEAEPAARRELRALVGEVAARGEIIRAGRFTKLDSRGERLLYVDARREQQLEGVLVFDRSNAARPYLVAAQSGAFRFDPETLSGALRLQNGDIHFETPERGASIPRPRARDALQTQRISFAHFDYRFDMQRLVGIEALRPREMSSAQLARELARFAEDARAREAASATAGCDEARGADCLAPEERARYALQLERRGALSAAPLLFALVGVPLAARRRRGARAYGVLLCVALVSGYYALLSFAGALTESGAAPARLALWTPNAALALCAIWLLARSGRPEA